MSKFKIGDRVQIIGDPTDYDLGTVERVRSSFGEDFCTIKWDSQGPRQVDADELFLVFRDGGEYQTPGRPPRWQGEWPPNPLPRESDIERAARLDDMAAPTFAQQVDTILGDLGALLKRKNEAYGDSALNPVRIFSKADPADGLRVRIDDKLSRIARGADAGEDTVTDLLGYLVMLKISEGNK